MAIALYRTKADKAFQKYLIKLHPLCEICGQPASCHHHFHTKASSSALRFEENNMVAVCSKCHLGFHSNRVAFFASIIIAKRGVKWSNALLAKKSDYVKPSVGYYKSITEKYEKLLDKVS